MTNGQQDTFHTVAGPATGLFRDRGSRFLSFAYAMRDADQLSGHLEELRALHPKARHACYAYRMGPDGSSFRANDDGEPSGTAGRPILGQIDHFGLTDVLVVVVRYFGGTLLGTAGLINAYRRAAADALAAAGKEEKVLQVVLQLNFPYTQLPTVMHAVKRMDLPILAQSYYLDGMMKVALRHARQQEQMLELKALMAGVPVSEALTLPFPDGLELKLLDTFY
jgi:uncharacterized YigZ family protein